PDGVHHPAAGRRAGGAGAARGGGRPGRHGRPGRERRQGLAGRHRAAEPARVHRPDALHAGRRGDRHELGVGVAAADLGDRPAGPAAGGGGPAAPHVPTGAAGGRAIRRAGRGLSGVEEGDPMSVNAPFARRLRLRRLYRHADQRLLVVPLDHSVTDGPVTGGRRVNRLIGRLAGNSVDAVVLHKGSLRYIDHRRFADTSLIVHLSATTPPAPDPDAKYLGATGEEALRLGADAVSVHVNLGSREEARQVADLAAVADACDRWSLPLLAMMYPRGPRIENPATRPWWRTR